MSKILPCPKCGCDEHISLDSSREAEASWILCGWCDYRFQRRLDEESLTERWNALSRKRMPVFDMEEELAKLDKGRLPACDDCKRLREKLDFWYRRATANNPTAAAGGGEVVARDPLDQLIRDWRTRIPENCRDTERIVMREWCADQLEAALGRGGG